MSMRQFTRRLEWITAENDPPRKSGYIGEQVLFALADDPRTVLRPHLMNTILNLRPPLTFIPEHERLSLRKIALVAEDGLPAAIEELAFSSDRPISLRRLRTIRVAAAIVHEELSSPDGETQFLAALWREAEHGFMDSFMGIFVAVAEDLGLHLQTPSSYNVELVEQLCYSSHELLGLLHQLLPCLPMTTRCLQSLMRGVVETSIAAAALCRVYPHSEATTVARNARAISMKVVSQLSAPTTFVEPDKLAALVMLRTLLMHIPDTHQDPVYHNVQIVQLIDHILPTLPDVEEEEDSSYWALDVFPSLLPELNAFLQRQTTQDKICLVTKLADLDAGDTGVAEWLVIEELTRLLATFRSLKSSVDGPYRATALYGVHESLAFLQGLFSPTLKRSDWFSESLGSVEELSDVLAQCLTEVIEGNYEDDYLLDIVSELSTHIESLGSALQFAVALSQLHLNFSDTFHLQDTLDFLRRLPKETLSAPLLSSVIGRVLIRHSKSTRVEAEMAVQIMDLLEWFVDGVDSPRLPSALIDDLMDVVPPDAVARLQGVRPKITPHDDDNLGVEPPTSIELPRELQFSLPTLIALIRPEDEEPPSTPKTGHKTPEELGVIISPPTALLRSFTSTGLTKKYNSNEFRDLRLSPVARQNTSRLPSTHSKPHSIPIFVVGSFVD